MALKVVSSKPATSGLRVVQANGGLGQSTYNPQQTVSPQVTYNPQGRNYNPQQTYNPQKTATAAQIAATTRAQFAANQRAAQIQRDRQIAEAAAVKRRLTDAKNAELKVRSGNWLGKLGDKASFGALRRQRGGRELAVKYWKENDEKWGKQLMARQRNYEAKGAQLKDWVMQASNEAEYNKRAQEANAWLDREYKAINADIADFTKTQKELAAYSQTPLKGKFATAGRAVKNVVAGVAGTSWNALTTIASQPQRVVNTGKNFVNPNNLRQYYGGKEVKQPNDVIGRGKNAFQKSLDQLRKSYNVSKDQRIFGFSKADEAARLKGWKKELTINGKKRTVTRTPSGIDRFRVKYGDDIVDMISDPLTWFTGAGAASKAKKLGISDRLMAMAGKNKRLRDTLITAEIRKQQLANTKLGRAGAWLGKEHKPREEAARDAIQELQEELRKTGQQYKTQRNKTYAGFDDELLQQNKKRSGFITTQAQKLQALEARKAGFAIKQERLQKDYVKALDNFSDREVRSMTKWARNGQWSRWDKVNLSKGKRKELETLVTDYQERARAMAKAEGLQRRANRYLPEFSGKGYDPTARRSLFGDKYYGQSRQQLQESLIMREFASSWDESSQHVKDIERIEKSIRRQAAKTHRGLSQMELEKLAMLGKRKAEIRKLTGSYKRQVDTTRDKMGFVRQASKPAFKVNRRGVETNFTKQGLKNSAADAFHLPMRIWKKSVLKYNPAWYVNNTAWNVPASVSAAGKDVFSEYGKLLTNRKYRESVMRELPEGVASKISREVGKAGLATKIEDTSRVATFLALKKKGFSDEKALKQVNRWLFDYRTKNWERPIKGLLPFWQWQKSIIRLGTTMPLHSPRSAKVYSEGYKKFYDRPYNNLPDEVQEYEDPETGEKVKYNPREAYKGKAYLGKDKNGNDRFAGLPFFAVNPETALNFGVNPYLMAASDYVTSSDRFNQSNTDRSGLSILGERFPQANLARKFKERNLKQTTTWFSQSGNSKQKQGSDPSKSNYDKSLDKRIPAKNAGLSFLGIPRVISFDKKEFDTKKRLTNFNKAFFAIDWDKKEDADYKGAQKEKEALAKKYGFDLKNDIYKKYWSKYDTETTKNTKKLKEEAARFNSPDSGYWGDYFALPAGSKTSASKRRPFLISKFEEWKRDHTFGKNPYYKLPKNGGLNPFALKSQEAASVARRSAGKAKYQKKLDYEYAKRTGDWSMYRSKYGEGRKRSPFTYQGKYFKTAQSRDRYIAGRQKYETGKLWAGYYAIADLAGRKAYLARHPQLKTFEQPKNQAEWDALRAKLRQKSRDKASKLPNFEQHRQAFMAETNAKVAKGFKTFGRSKRLTYK